MNKQNIEQIIRELFKDNYRAYTADYDTKNDGQQARLNARTVANEYWNTRQDDEISRDEQAGVTKDDYVKWVMAELGELIPAVPDYHNSYTTTHDGEQFNIVEKIEPFGEGFRSSVTINGEVWGESDTNKTLEEAKWLFNQDYFAETE